MHQKPAFEPRLSACVKKVWNMSTARHSLFLLFFIMGNLRSLENIRVYVTKEWISLGKQTALREAYLTQSCKLCHKKQTTQKIFCKKDNFVKG